jgi:pyrroloquinoline quinone (PQQ) biosynthesis protein C
VHKGEVAVTLTETQAPSATRDLNTFRSRVDELVRSHPVVAHNRYTTWFASGAGDREDVRHLTVQFSVFSHLFVEAQLRKVINAADIESYRAGKEILMNELGVIFNGRADNEGIATEGTVDGSRYRHPAAHFEWLLRFARPLGLEFADLGKRRHATPSTQFFCDELLRVYGSEDASIAEGASFAVEHWAAAGFWKELIAGLQAFKDRECPDLHLGFWTWHDKVEDQHAAHTADELAEAFFNEGFDEELFLQGAREMLDGVKAFWDGLDADRLARRRAGESLAAGKAAVAGGVGTVEGVGR